MKVLRAIALVAGIAAAAVAFSPTMDRLADSSFAWHMVEHLLLIYVSVPLVLLSGPLLLLVRALPVRYARFVVTILRHPVVRTICHPVVTWFFFVAVMWGTHFSSLYELALTVPAVHVAEHALYVFAALLFWQNIIRVGPPVWDLIAPLRAMYVFAAIPPSAFLGLAIYQSQRILYAHYLVTQGSYRAALLDQQNAGAVMWLGGGLVLFVAFMIVTGTWAYAERRYSERESYA